MPSSPGQAAAWAFSAAMSNLPSARWQITPFGAPPSRMRAVSARVSMPETPGMPWEASQSSQVLRRAVVGRLGHVLLDDQAARGGRDRLDVLGVGADIADVGEGEGDDLPGIGRVGQRLLVAGHAGVEADLAHLGRLGAEAAAPEDGAVGEHHAAGGAVGWGIGRVHGGLRLRGFGGCAGHVGERQAGGGEDGRPVLRRDGAGLAPFADGFRADATMGRRRLGAAEQGDDVFHAAHGGVIAGNDFPRQWASASGKFPPRRIAAL
jgi:hypothetical protein